MKIKYRNFGANGNLDPRHREGSNIICSGCGKNFSFWDNLQMSPCDEKVKCTKCKGIVIYLVQKTN